MREAIIQAQREELEKDPMVCIWGENVEGVGGGFMLTTGLSDEFGERVKDTPLAEAGTDHQLDAYTHLYTLNRGILITPFHNMLLISPQTSVEDVDRFDEVFRSLTQNLV